MSTALHSHRTTGRVLDSLTHAPVPGLRVEAWDAGADVLLATDNTDVEGYFRHSFAAPAFSSAAGPSVVLAATPPTVYFKIFHGSRLLKETSEAAAEAYPAAGAPGEEVRLEFEVDLPAGPPAGLPEAAEVAIHELGESLAATVASMQNELARYNTALGAYVLEEFDLSIPVLLRVGGLGQIMATVTQTQRPDAAVGQIRLRLKPSAGPAPAPASPAAGLPLDALGLLSREEIARLEGERIFCVGDLLRVASTAAGRAALASEVFGAGLSGVLDRALLLSLPIPPLVSQALIKSGFSRPASFIDADPSALAETLSRSTETPIGAGDVERWQAAAADYINALS